MRWLYDISGWPSNLILTLRQFTLKSMKTQWAIASRLNEPAAKACLVEAEGPGHMSLALAGYPL